MKTKLRALLIALLCVALAAGFSGCGMLKTIRENARIDNPFPFQKQTIPHVTILSIHHPLIKSA